MSAKKAKKANLVKKAAKNNKAKIIKKVAKKNVVKKSTPKAKPKTKLKAKPTAKKAVVKKVVKKIAVKKPQKIQVKKPVKSTKKPLVTKKLPKAKAGKNQPVVVIEENTKAKNALTKKALAKSALAKTILANTAAKEKNIEKKVEVSKTPERKNEAPQKIIIVKKSEGRSKINFKIGDYAVYPSHGIGKIADIEKTSILGQDFSCYLMYFEKEKLTIKIPMHSAEKIGLRHLISKSQMDEVFVILRSGVKKLKGMWSRRAQEYETKINSGDIILLAEVLRDLTRDIEDGERSYSERIIYETAIHRLANEYSVIYGIDFEEAKAKVVITAKDKLNSEGKVSQKDEFDEFEIDGESESSDEEGDEDEEEEDEDEDEDEDYDDEDEDEKPRKKSKK